MASFYIEYTEIISHHNPKISHRTPPRVNSSQIMLSIVPRKINPHPHRRPVLPPTHLPQSPPPITKPWMQHPCATIRLLHSYPLDRRALRAMHPRRQPRPKLTPHVADHRRVHPLPSHASAQGVLRAALAPPSRRIITSGFLPLEDDGGCGGFEGGFVAPNEEEAALMQRYKGWYLCFVRCWAFQD